MTITAQDIKEFNAYLRNCTDAQVQGVYEKERTAGRDVYAELAAEAANSRDIDLACFTPHPTDGESCKRFAGHDDSHSTAAYLEDPEGLH